MKKILIYIILDSIESLVLEKNSKKSSGKFGNLIPYLSFKIRIIEQIISYIKFNYIFFPTSLVCFLVINGFPFWFSSYGIKSTGQRLKIKKVLKHVLRYLKENFYISLIDQEIEGIKSIQDSQKFYLDINLMFFIMYNLSRKFDFLKINVFNLFSDKKSALNLKKFKETLNISRKFHCTFSFFVLIRELPFLKFLSFFSNGYFGQIIGNIIKLLYSNKFLQLLLNLFWVNIVSRELFSKSFQIQPKLFNNKISTQKIFSQCGFCKSIFKTNFSNCFVCGNSYLYKFN